MAQTGNKFMRFVVAAYVVDCWIELVDCCCLSAWPVAEVVEVGGSVGGWVACMATCVVDCLVGTVLCVSCSVV